MSDDKAGPRGWRMQPPLVQGAGVRSPPPHNLITKVLKKLRQDNATVLLLVPNWPDGPWGQTFRNMVVSETLTLQLSEKDVRVGRGANLLAVSRSWLAAILSPSL